MTGKVTDQNGNAIEGVVVSDGFTCVKTDAQGKYAFNRNANAKFVYYTVPADCEVPVHSATDNTANFYLPLAEGTYEYDFKLTKLAGGKETNHMVYVVEAYIVYVATVERVDWARYSPCSTSLPATVSSAVTPTSLSTTR